MKEWVPLLQTLVWPIALGLLVYWNRDALKKVSAALAKRIAEGAPIKAGGVEIGAAPSLPPVPKEDDPRHIDELPHDVYIVHVARRDRRLDTADKEYYRLLIFLDADTPERLDDVAAVTYRLHPSFRDPVRQVSDRQSSFEIRTAGWGEFNMTAEVSFKGGKRLVVERYINLPAIAA